MSLVSPVLVGRQEEAADLRQAMARAGQGHGGTVFVLGEPGIGKSRLASTLAAEGAAAGACLLRGRAGTVPLRALTEVIFAAVRTAAVSQPELGPFWQVLWRLAPDAAGGAADPPVVRAEAVLRLLALSGAAAGCVLLIEDLHEADRDTLAILDYLIDNVWDQPVLILATLRPDPGAALDLATAAADRRAARTVRLDRLDRAETAELAAACLGAARLGEVPPAVLERVHRESDGVPFVVEELLAATEAGVPPTVAAAVAARVARLDPDGAALLQSAAIFGRGFSARLAARVAGIDPASAERHLRQAGALELVAPDTADDPDRYAFRHALTAAAIVSRLTPGTRTALSGAAAAAVEMMGLDERLAAELWVAGGEPTRAAALFGKAGRRAATRGALATAIELLDRGIELAGTGTSLVAELLDELVRALVLAGDTGRVLALGPRLDAALAAAGAPVERRIAAHLARARAAGTSGQWERGLDEVAAARALAAAAGPAACAPIDAVAAALLLGSGRAGRPAEAAALAERAVTVAESALLPEVACEALEVLSRCARGQDLTAAHEYVERTLAVAELHGLSIWRIRALLELGVIDKYRFNDPARLLAARQAAADTGAVVMIAWIDLHLASLYLHLGRLAEVAELAQGAAAVARRLGLHELVLLAAGLEAGIAAALGRRDELERILAGVQGRPVLGYGLEVWGHARGICALLEEDHEQALADFADAARADQHVGAIRGSAYQGPYLLLRVATGQAGWPEYDRYAASHLAQMRLHQLYLGWSRAVLLGRDGRGSDATTAAGEARAMAAAFPLPRHLGARLAAPSALADGWGNPRGWLREAEEYFLSIDVPRVAAACRTIRVDTADT